MKLLLTFDIRLTCHGIALELTPKIPHFLGVRKYTGPGYCGLDV